MRDRKMSKEISISTLWKSGKIIPALCNIIGILLLLGVIITALPISVPRLIGYDIFNVVTGSMEPNIKIGDLVYSKYNDPEKIETGDIIVYLLNDNYIVHRVVRNQVIDGSFITKGDANDSNDPESVSYESYLGRVEYHFPAVGRFLSIYSSNIGKVYVMMLAACGLMFNIVAERLRKRKVDRVGILTADGDDKAIENSTGIKTEASAEMTSDVILKNVTLPDSSEVRENDASKTEAFDTDKEEDTASDLLISEEDSDYSKDNSSDAVFDDHNDGENLDKEVPLFLINNDNVDIASEKSEKNESLHSENIVSEQAEAVSNSQKTSAASSSFRALPRDEIKNRNIPLD